MIPKENRKKEIIHFFGQLPVESLYTAGIAGERFLLGLKEGRFLANYCEDCDFVFLPPKLYCEFCFRELKEEDLKEIENKGILLSYTFTHVDTNGNRLENPIIVGVIRMDGSDTGFVHKLLDKVEDIEIGMEVEAVFAPKERRRGSINDIVGFRRIR